MNRNEFFQKSALLMGVVAFTGLASMISDASPNYSIGDVLPFTDEEINGRFYICAWSNRKIEIIRQCCSFDENGEPLFWMRDRYVDTGEVHSFTDRVLPFMKEMFPSVTWEEL